MKEKLFYTGNVVQTCKDDLLDFIDRFVKENDLIIPLIIIPITDDIALNYTAITQGVIIVTQEDPIFIVMTRI